MAVSGLLFIAFVLMHMYGNLKAFQGHDTYNAYAEHLRTFGEPILPREGLLWILRLGLLAALALHVYSALALWHRAGKARRTKYVAKKNLGSSFSSRTMRWGGVTLLLFVVWHLLHFTIVKINPAGGATNDPYNLVVDSFQEWWMTIIYLVAMAALGLHLHQPVIGILHRPHEGAVGMGGCGTRGGGKPDDRRRPAGEARLHARDGRRRRDARNRHAAEKPDDLASKAFALLVIIRRGKRPVFILTRRRGNLRHGKGRTRPGERNRLRRAWLDNFLRCDFWLCRGCFGDRRDQKRFGGQ